MKSDSPEVCGWCSHPTTEHREPDVDPYGPALTEDGGHVCLVCHLCYPDREALRTRIENNFAALRTAEDAERS